MAAQKKWGQREGGGDEEKGRGEGGGGNRVRCQQRPKGMPATLQYRPNGLCKVSVWYTSWLD